MTQTGKGPLLKDWLEDSEVFSESERFQDEQYHYQDPILCLKNVCSKLGQLSKNLHFNLCDIWKLYKIKRIWICRYSFISLACISLLKGILQSLFHFFLLIENNQFYQKFVTKQIKTKQNKTTFTSYPIQKGEDSSAGIPFLLKGPPGPSCMSSFLQQCRQELMVGQASCGHEIITGMRAPC